MDDVGRELRAALLELFARPAGTTLSDRDFNGFAVRVFAWQYGHNAPYAAYCDRRGRTPATVTSWTEIPPVPTAAFREVALVTADVAGAEAVFRTSGTTRGAEQRGTHYILDLLLYHASLLPNFAARVLTDGARPLMLSLLPPSNEMPDSSLAHMIGTVMNQFGADGSAYCASVEAGIAQDALRASLEAAQSTGTPVCLLGTSSAFVHWLDAMIGRGESHALPAGSRIMDTGGYKGRGRAVPEDEMRTLYAEQLAVPPSHCINEYGMTEMCSQFYDSSLADFVSGRVAPRRKLTPPWVRTRVVDPVALEPVEPGTTGILQHVDLANMHSVVAVQTEDLGTAVQDGFVLHGRAPGAAPRGCSLAMDLLLDAVAQRRG